LAFVLGGLSKCLALPQLKLAWTSMLGPAPLLRAAQARIENIADTYLSVGTPIQLALPELLALRGELTLPLKARISQNYALLGARLAGTALTPLRVEGGFSAVIQLPNTQSESAWALSFLEQARVLVQPGFFYGFGQEPYIVLSLITPEADFALGLDRLVAQVEFSLVSPIHGP
jgi:aspartate/methionine/tyrosine aminotransferase